MRQQRPVNLDLSSFKYPPMAIASILHRLSGIVLFLLLPVMLYWLDISLDSEASFTALRVTLEDPYHKLILWVFSSALMYHFVAGIRHMMMDLGHGDELLSGRRSAVMVIALAVFCTIFLGVWIW